MGPSRILELHELQESFQSLLVQAHPSHIAAFFYWLDLQVAQFKIFGSCLAKEDNASTPVRKRLFASDLQPAATNGVYSPGHSRSSILLDGSAGGSLLQDRNGLSNGHTGFVNNIPAHVAHAPRNAHEHPVQSSVNASAPEELHGLSKQQLVENQMVKSLLRAMLAKSKSDCGGTVEALVKHERHIDSSSDDTSELAVCAVQAKDDDDDRSVNGSLARDDPMSMESETESSALQNGSFTKTENSEETPGSAEKSSRCPYCLKIFRYRSSYRRHVKIHEGIFSHECMVCQRKFTRKEHFVRHKCDRRANKPYHLSHYVFHRERKTSVKSAAGRIGLNEMENSPMNYGEMPEQNCHLPDVPLELTNQSPLKWNSSTVAVGVASEYAGHGTSSSPAVLKTTHGDGNQEVTNDGFDASLLLHNEKRRKSSTPRKVVSLKHERLANIDSNCDVDYMTKRDKFDGITFDLSHPVH